MTFPSVESIQIILPVVSALFLLLSLDRPVYGVISYFIILNAKLGDMYPVLGLMRIELVAAIVVFMSLISRGNLKNIFPKHNPLNKSLWWLFAVGMLSVPFAVDPVVSWENGGYTLLKLTLFYIMIVASLNKKEDLHKMLWAVVLMTAWTAYEPVTNYLSGSVKIYGYGAVAKGRFGAAAGHVALANTLCHGLPIVFYWLFIEKGRVTKSILVAIAAITVLGIIFSKSRGGGVGLMAISLGVIYFSKKRMQSVVLFVLVLIFLAPFAGQQYLDHMSSISQGISGGRSQSDRYMGLVNGISMMLKRPILGVGIGCYATARKKYFNYYFYAHNLYGELMGELGLASSLWFYWVFSVYRAAGQLKTKLAENLGSERFYFNLLTGIQVSLFVRLVLGNFSHSAFIWFWFLMAALTVSIEQIRKVPTDNAAFLE